MSKAVLMSIQPKWCELIASGKKRIEVRKTRPQLETPFKVYIYQTKGKWLCSLLYSMGFSGMAMKLEMSRGKVIGEFMCNFIRVEKEIACGLVDVILENASCVFGNDLIKYANGKFLYSWNISNLVIYDKPKELSEFYKECEQYDCDGDCPYFHFENTPMSYEGWCECNEKIPITRPPQSWCYVEELSE